MKNNLDEDIEQIKSSLKELETERDNIQLLCIKSELELSVENILKELETYKKIVDNAQEQIEIAERTYDIEELNQYARGMYDAFKMVIDWARKEVEK